MAAIHSSAGRQCAHHSEQPGQQRPCEVEPLVAVVVAVVLAAALQGAEEQAVDHVPGSRAGQGAGQGREKGREQSAAGSRRACHADEDVNKGRGEESAAERERSPDTRSSLSARQGACLEDQAAGEKGWVGPA